jgi:hypothetical protein
MPLDMTGRLARYAAPNDGCWVGAAVDYTVWDYNLTRYINAVGYNPASWNIFVELPMTPLEVEKLDALLPIISRFRGIALITLEPLRGISERELPDEDILAFCELVRKYEEDKALRVMVRFAHEMNGNWYPW